MHNVYPAEWRPGEVWNLNIWNDYFQKCTKSYFVSYLCSHFVDKLQTIQMGLCLWWWEFAFLLCQQWCFYCLLNENSSLFICPRAYHNITVGGHFADIWSVPRSLCGHNHPVMTHSYRNCPLWGRFRERIASGWDSISFSCLQLPPPHWKATTRKHCKRAKLPWNHRHSITTLQRKLLRAL